MKPRPQLWRGGRLARGPCPFCATRKPSERTKRGWELVFLHHPRYRYRLTLSATLNPIGDTPAAKGIGNRIPGKSKEKLLIAWEFRDVTIGDDGFGNLWFVSAAAPA